MMQMSIDINKINSNRPEGPIRHDTGKITTPSAQSAESQSTNTPSQGTRDSVSLSSTAQNLAKIETELKTLPDVDQSKVDAIKAQIESGDYQINSQNLAQKMLNIEV